MSIHQESLIAAPPQQVFELLTSGSLFSAATGMPAEITDREGDAFSGLRWSSGGPSDRACAGPAGRAGVAFWHCASFGLGARRLFFAD